MEVARRLKLIREEHHLSQNDLALKLNITRQSVSKWETGKGYPDLDNLILLSEIYQITIDELLKEEKIDRKNESVRDNCVMEKINHVDNQSLYFLVLATIGCLHPIPGIFIQGYLLKINHKNNSYYLVTQFIVFSCFVIGIVRIIKDFI